MFSLAITTFNRPSLTVQAFERVHDHELISEIIIQDDGSSEKNFNELRSLCFKYKKVRVIQNSQNVGMGLNKARAIKNCSEEWVIIFDSDNIIDHSYIDAIPEHLNKNTIYCPSFAKPSFDYRAYSHRLIGKEDAKRIIKEPHGEPLFNTCNYVVHRESYGEVFCIDNTIKATDTIRFAHQWLSSGNYFYVVKDMQYFHRVHEGSGFLADPEYNMKKSLEYKKKILSL